MQRLPDVPTPIRRAVAVCCAVVILSGSLLDPGDGVPRGLLGIDVSVYAHAVAYAGLAGAIGYAALSVDRRTLLAAAAIATVYGAGIEVLQGLVSYRTMAATDALLNAIAAAGGTVCWWLVAPRFGVDRGSRPFFGPPE